MTTRSRRVSRSESGGRVRPRPHVWRRTGCAPRASAQRARRVRSAACLTGFALLFGLGVFVACSKKVGPQTGGAIQRITAKDQLIGGPEAAGRIGDWLLTNGRVRFIVEDAGSSNGWGLFGGSLVDLDRVRAPGEPGDDRLQEFFYQCNLKAFDPEKAEVVNDGRDGKPAVLRMTGKDRGLPLIEAALPTPSLGLEISVDYVLPKDGDTLEIVLRAKDEGKMGTRQLACGVFTIRGDGYDAFYPGTGFGKPESATIPYLAAASADSTSSFVFYRKSGDLSVELQQSKVLPLATETRDIRSGGTFEEHFFVSVGTGDVESALRERRRVLGDDATDRRTVNVRVGAPADLSALLPRVVLTFLDTQRADPTRAITSARPDASGLATAQLSPGEYQVTLSYEGRDSGQAMLSVPAGATDPIEATARLTAYGELDVDTVRTDAQGTAIGPTPAKLSLVQGADQPPSGPRIVERYLAASDSVIVPAGSYTAYVSRGPEYELHKENVVIVEGQKTSLHAKVAHVVDTAGWIGADLHVHSTKSVDADAGRPLRVLAAVAEGVEILVSTDHDIVTDYAPFVKAQNLEDQLKTVCGTEVSPAYGHINGFPLTAESPEAYWRVAWYQYHDDGTFDRVLDPAEIVRALRALKVEYVQINHPRSGQGVFNYIQLDPMTAKSRLEFPAADGFEILNSKDGKLFDQALQDFISLIKADQRMTGTGVSDAHGAYSGVGYARTMIRVTKDDPSSVDMDEAYRSLRQGKVVALSGPMVTLKARQGAKTAEVGETLQASGPIALDLHIEAPSWMDVASYRVIENGNVLAQGAILPPRAGSAVRLDTTVMADVASDAFYLVIVEGAPGSTSQPVLDAQARTVTNAIFVDANGDGFHYGS